MLLCPWVNPAAPGHCDLGRLVTVQCCAHSAPWLSQLVLRGSLWETGSRGSWVFTVRFQSWALIRSQEPPFPGSKPLTTVSSLWSKGSGRQRGRKWLAQSSGQNYLGRKIITFHGLGTGATATGGGGGGRAGWPGQVVAPPEVQHPPGATKL